MNLAATIMFYISVGVVGVGGKLAAYLEVGQALKLGPGVLVALGEIQSDQGQCVVVIDVIMGDGRLGDVSMMRLLLYSGKEIR